MKKERVELLQRVLDKYSDRISYDLERGEFEGYKSNGKLKSIREQDGYKLITFDVDLKTRKFYSHEIIAFLGGLSIEGKEVNHIDGNKHNNSISNLEAVSRGENIRHAFKLGLNKGHVGEKHGCSILTEADVITIRRRISEGEKQVQLAREYDVNKTTINAIKHRRIWKHI